MARAISPPSASISRTRWPLPGPPMLGLQGIWAMRSRFIVSRSVLAPILAAARAASQPACPAPTTITSYSIRASHLRHAYWRAACRLDRAQAISGGAVVRTNICTYQPVRALRFCPRIIPVIPGVGNHDSDADLLLILATCGLASPMILHAGGTAVSLCPWLRSNWRRKAQTSCRTGPAGSLIRGVWIAKPRAKRSPRLDGQPPSLAGGPLQWLEIEARADRHVGWDG